MTFTSCGPCMQSKDTPWKVRTFAETCDVAMFCLCQACCRMARVKRLEVEWKLRSLGLRFSLGDFSRPNFFPLRSASPGEDSFAAVDFTFAMTVEDGLDDVAGEGLLG